MTKLKTLMISLFTIGIFSIMVALPVSAASLINPAPATQSKGVSLTTSPVYTVLTAKPGTSVSSTIQVMNNTSTPLNITMQVQTFRNGGTGGQAQIITPGAGQGFIKWVTFSQNSFTAQPGVWTPVQMTIDVPTYAGLGYYFAILVKPSTTIAGGNHTNTLKSSNAVLVLLNAQTNNEQLKIALTSFTSAKHIYEYLPAEFNVSVYNNGNIFLAPYGNIFISKTSNFSKIIDVLPVNAEQGNVLPGATRIYTSTWSDGFPVFVPKTLGGQPVTDSSGKKIYQLQYNFSQNSKFRFGKYYAKVVLVYNNGTRDVPQTAIVSFWVIPWKIIILLIIFIAIIVGTIYLLIRLSRKVKKQTKWQA
jgi:hypothetical protein